MRLLGFKFILFLFAVAIFPACNFKHRFSNADPDAVEKQKKDDYRAATRAQLTAAVVSRDFQLQSVNSITPYALEIKNNKEGPATGLSGLWAGSAEFNFLGGSFPGLGGTCQNTLPGNSSCLVMVTFRPTGVASYSAKVTLNYDAYGHADAVAINFRGAGANIATIRSEDSAALGSQLSNLGTVVTNATPLTKTFQIRHFGVFAAIGVNFSMLSPSFSISSNSCPEIVSGDCALTVTTSLTTPGVYTGSLRITYNNGSFVATDVRDITVTVTSAVIPATLAVSNAGFGRILKLTSSTTGLTVTKSGTLPAIVNSASFSLPAVFSFVGGTYPGTGGTCPAFGAAMSTSSCTLSIKYQSNGVSAHADTLVLNFNNGTGSGNNAVSSGGGVTGDGGNEAILSIDAAPTGDFTTVSVGRPVTQTFTMRNGNSSVAASSITFPTLPAPFSITSNSCTGGIAGGGACNFTVRFLPTAAIASDYIMEITYNDGSSLKSVFKEVQGIGTRAPTLIISNVSFAPVIVSNTAMVVNTTSASANVTYYGLDPAFQVGVSALAAPYSFEGGGAFPGSTGTCGASVTANCTIRFTFSPTAANAASVTKVFSYAQTDGGIGIVANFTLSGTGVNPGNLILTPAVPSPYPFGDQPYNSISDVQLTLQNNGASTASSIVATGLAAPITFRGGTYPGSSGNCGSSLAAGGTCNLYVRFSPTPTLTGGAPTLTINYFTGSASTSITYSFTGTSHPEGSLSLPGIAFGDVPVASSSSVQSLTITNTGTSDVTGVSLAAVAAPFVQISNDCTSSLTVGSVCHVSYRFDPTVPGVKSQSVTVNFTDNSTIKTATGVLSGGGTMATQIAANGEHTCFKNRYQQVYCWGHNNVAQLGQGDLNDRGAVGGQVASLSAINLGVGRYAKKIAAGFYHNCAILDNNDLKCWGGNTAGQLGIGTTASTVGGAPGQMAALPPVNLGTGLYAVDVVAGYAHSCALLNNGNVKCWGQNSQGQLGQGDTQNRGASASQMGDNLPIVDLGGSSPPPVASLSVGASDTCAVLVSGALKCWGDNFYAQLGLGDWNHRGDEPYEMGNNLPAVEFEHDSPIRLLASGGAFRIFAFASGQIAGIGRNDASGNLGKLLSQNSAGVAGFYGGDYTFVLPAYGRLASHRIGDALSTIDLGPTPLSQIVAGNTHTCVRFNDNKTKCWGENLKGQLGIGTTASVGAGANDMGTNLLETILSSTAKASVLSSGSFHVCAILTNNSLKCWGDNRFGQLGLGDTVNRGDNSGEMGDSLPVIPAP